MCRKSCGLCLFRVNPWASPHHIANRMLRQHGVDLLCKSHTLWMSPSHLDGAIDGSVNAGIP